MVLEVDVYDNMERKVYDTGLLPRVLLCDALFFVLMIHFAYDRLCSA